MLFRSICSDSDANAIDQLYIRVRARQQPITPVVLNAIFPMQSVLCREASERFRSDMVIALALTHHLLLSQKIPGRTVFKAIKRYAKRNVVVEFMPLGLWDGRTSLPLPKWYNREWFREEFTREFELISEEQLEENRIVLVEIGRAHV